MVDRNFDVYQGRNISKIGNKMFVFVLEMSRDLRRLL